jgi:hypothetical protein
MATMSKHLDSFNQNSVTFYVALWKRSGINRASFDNYWKDVHGPVCARLPGQHDYWQYHLGPAEGGIFPAVEGVQTVSSVEEQFHGIAELTFLGPEQRQEWFQASTILMDDEHNIFSKAIGYTTSPGQSKTLVEKEESTLRNGLSTEPRYHLLIRKSPDQSVDRFREFIHGTLAPGLASIPEVLKLRYHLFDELDLSRPDAQGVAHSEPVESQYHGAIEIAFRNPLDRERALSSSKYLECTTDLKTYVSALIPFPEETAYTFVHHEMITMSGMRGAYTAQLIDDLGALNQLKDDITSLMMGT